MLICPNRTHFIDICKPLYTVVGGYFTTNKFIRNLYIPSNGLSKFHSCKVLGRPALYTYSHSLILIYMSVPTTNQVSFCPALCTFPRTIYYSIIPLLIMRFLLILRYLSCELLFDAIYYTNLCKPYNCPSLHNRLYSSSSSIMKITFLR